MFPWLQVGVGVGQQIIFKGNFFTQIHSVVDNVIEECGLSPGILRFMYVKTNCTLKIHFLFLIFSFCCVKIHFKFFLYILGA